MGQVSAQAANVQKLFLELLLLIDFDLLVRTGVTVPLHEVTLADGNEILVEDGGELLLI